MNKILIGLVIGLFLISGITATIIATAPHSFRLYEVKLTQKSCVQICDENYRFCAGANQFYIEKSDARYWMPVDCKDTPNRVVPNETWTVRCNCFK